MKTTFIFGAGASAVDGAATGSEILEKAFELLHDRKPAINVKDFVKAFFNTETLPTFEEVLTLVDVAISKREALSSVWDFDKLMELRKDLLYCLVMTLDQQLRSRGRSHSQFVQALFESYSYDELAFISLNYDILLDNALTRLKDTEDFDLDYAVDFRNFGSEWSRPRTKRSTYLLKLHGSLNWLYCPNCSTLKITPLQKGVTTIWTEFKICEKDKTSQQPLLIPPTWIKFYDNAKLSQIWSKAEEVLRQTKNVVFVGYSLPESDVHVRYLLTKSLFRRGRKGPSIIAITGKREKGSHSTAYRRYHRLFKEPIVHQIGFEKFVKNIDRYLNS